MKLVLFVLSTLIVISAARLTLKPSPRRDITFPRRVEYNDGEQPDTRATVPRKVEEMQPPVKMMPPAIDANPAKLRDARRKKVKQTSTRENETVRVTNSTTSSSNKERKLHTKIVHVPEPFVVHVEKPYPVYIEKPIIVEKHIPMHLYITKKESKHR